MRNNFHYENISHLKTKKWEGGKSGNKKKQKTIKSYYPVLFEISFFPN